jgi:hypothetical protein
VLSFELKLLDELGMKPVLDETRLNAGTRKIASALLESDWPDTAQLRPSAAQITELSQFLHGFLIYHLGKIPANRAAAVGLRLQHAARDQKSKQ